MEQTADPLSYETGGLRVDVKQRVLVGADGQRVALPSRAFELLLCFLRHPGELLDKNRLMSAVWPNSVVEENNLTQNIGVLRRALGEVPGEHRFLVTEPGRGYRFVAAVKEIRAKAEVGAEPEVGAMPAGKPVVRDRRRPWLAWSVGFAVAAIAAALAHWWTGASRPADLSIAVLPFEDHSESRNNEYLALGIQDEILTLLTRVPELRVVPRTSALRYARRDASDPQIGRALAVSYLLEGSVQRAGERVRVRVRLIDAAADRHVWAETYERPAADVFAIESEVAQSVAQALRVSLTPEQRQSIARPPTTNPEAYDAYLRARASAERTTRTEAEILAAIASYEAAVRADPGFAAAWGQLSRRHANFFSLAYDRSDARRAAAQRALDEALRLAPDKIETQVSRGYFLFVVQGDLDAAERVFREIEARAPQSPDGPAGLEQIMAERGQLERSADYARRVLALDALNPYRHSVICHDYAVTGHLELALQTCERALKLLPGDAGITAIHASILQAMGELARSRAMLQSVTALPGDWRTLRASSRQRLLDRDPAGAVALLEDAMRNAGSLGTRRGVVRRWLADAHRHARNPEAAQAAYLQAAAEIEAELERQNANPVLLAELATVRGRLGQLDAALRLVSRCLDVAATPRRETYRAECAAARIPAEITAGDPARAVLALREAITAHGVLPPLTPALLKLDPDYDLLRARPDYLALLNGDPAGMAKSAPR
jgi:TolB-like protein/DNA-binding winged helix-turn-helix (wHTH) protein